MTIDINCDLGEGCANDAELMKYVSSANIACGFHAGDSTTMARTVELAVANGVAVGAHPGYRDRENFGRTPMSLSSNEVFEIVVEQIQTLQDICKRSATVVRHVKPVIHYLYRQIIIEIVFIFMMICEIFIAVKRL